jgi:hypothetical protein
MLDWWFWSHVSMKFKLGIIIGTVVAIGLVVLAARWWAYHRGDVIFYSSSLRSIVTPGGRTLPVNRWLRGADWSIDPERFGLLQHGRERLLIHGTPHDLVRAGSDTNLVIRVDEFMFRSSDGKTRYWISAVRPSEPDGATNRSPRIRSETNQTNLRPTAAGSGR